MPPPLQFEEEERQAIALALALLSLDRPGWDDFLTRIAGKLAAAEVYRQFQEIHGPRVRETTLDRRTSKSA